MIWPASQVRDLFRPAAEIYQDAAEGKNFDIVYFAMLVLACLIALLGLLLNSPAVVIGAMLISPLMGPILACGLALTTADWQIGKKAARNVALSVFEAVLIATIAIRLSPLREATPEILARTNPNLMDLLIAFFSGTAGTVALSSRKAAMTILPGVAIATAVVPPLATIGYGIGTLQWSLASGALMLFLTNFAAIVLSAGLVFLAVGVRPQKINADRQKFLSRHRIAIAALILTGLSIPLMETLGSAAQQARIRREVDALIRSRILQSQQRQVDSVKLQIGKDYLAVTATVQTVRFIQPQEVQALKTELTAMVGRPVRLEIQQLQLARNEKEATGQSSDYLGEGLRQRAASQEPTLVTTASISKAQDAVQTSLARLLAPATVDELSVSSIGIQSDGTLQVDVVARQKEISQQSAWQVAAEAVSHDLGVPLRIHAEVVSVDPSADLTFRPRSVRVSERQTAELRKLVRGASVAGKSYVLGYSPTDKDDLTKRRVEFLKRYLHAAELSSGPSPKLPADSITISEKRRFEVNGGEVPHR